MRRRVHAQPCQPPFGRADGSQRRRHHLGLADPATRPLNAAGGYHLLYAPNQALDEDDPEDVPLIEPLRQVLRVPFATLPATPEASSLGPALRVSSLTLMHKHDHENLIGDETLPYWSLDRPAEVWSDIADNIVELLDMFPPTPASDVDTSDLSVVPLI